MAGLRWLGCWALTVQHLQRPVDQGFGVGARHQHIGADLQVQTIKRFAAGQVGQRFALGAALSQRLQAGKARRRQQVGVVRQQPPALSGGDVQHMQQQQLGIQPVQALALQCHQGLADAGVVW